MKTKFILSAMCLPLAFAACTNEEVFVENQNALENAPVVELKVAATYGADALESRMVNNNGTFLWENTDVLGAAWNKSGGIYSNNKFVNTLTEASLAADFTTQATTVVGDYVFYYPYNTDVTKDLSSGIVYSLPEPQEYDPTGEKMMLNNFMISPNVTVDGNEPGELTLPLTMRSIYGYGKLNIKLPELFVINNTNVNSIYIQKIIVEYTSNVHKDGSIALTSVPTVDLKAETIEALIAGEYEGEEYTADFLEECEGKTEAEVRAMLFGLADAELTASTSAYKDGDILDLTSGTSYIKQVSVACVSNENPNGIKLGKNQTFSTRVLLPTTNDEGAEIKVTVYTDRGYIVILDTDAEKVGGEVRIKANHTANLANLNRVVNGADAFVLDGADVVTVDEINAISEADFIATVQNLSGNVNAVIGDFPLTPAAIAAIPEDVNLTFNSEVMFKGDMTLKNMNFAVSAILKEGDIILGENITSKYLQVNGANATIASSDFKDNALDYENSIEVYDGKLTIAALDAEGEATALDINMITGWAYYEGTAPEIIVNTEVNGTIHLISGASLTNKSNIEKLTISKNSVATNEGILERVTVEDADGILNNAGTVQTGVNKGTINQQAGGVVLDMANYSKVVTVANSEITTKQEDEAEVIYAEGARVAAEGGHVTYVAPASFSFNDFATLNDCVTKVLFEGDVTYAPSDAFTMDNVHKSVKTLEFKGNLTITTSKGVTFKENTELIFTGASSTIKSASVIKNVATIKVGVADVEATEDIDETVATNVTIVKGTKIEGFKSAVFYGGAQIWNEGTVVYPYGTEYSIDGDGTWKNEKPVVGPEPKPSTGA